MNWVLPNTMYVTLHGSRCYGLNNELSDVDVKGIFVPPLEIEDDLFQRFEQIENDINLENILSNLKNPKNPKFESVIYSLRKFMVLASNVNPNIIELLWTDPSDHLLITPMMKKFLEKRDLFLSSKAKFTFSGYAFAQAAKIDRHRKWIVLGDLKKPTRVDYGLPETRPSQLDEVFGFIKSEVERWNLSKYPMDEMDRSNLKETIWELLYNISQVKVGWDNWPQVYEAGVIEQLSRKYDLKEEVVSLLNREREYKRASEQYHSWLNWKENRNPDRHQLEMKSGYDTKHASHLVRLMRMGYEILTEGKVIVKRPDREEILSIKNGAWSYDKVMEYANSMQKKLDEAYKTTKLPKNVNFEKVNDLYHSLVNVRKYYT
jgi:predicted nucleotidyltransferase